MKYAFMIIITSQDGYEQRNSVYSNMKVLEFGNLELCEKAHQIMKRLNSTRLHTFTITEPFQMES